MAKRSSASAAAPGKSGAAGKKKSDTALAAMSLFIIAAAGLLTYLLAFTDATLDSATLGLVLAGVALVFCLRALYKMVSVLSRPDVTVALQQLPAAATASKRELREERRRLLRAINELKFDHDMGKLSDADYKAVRQTYELQAIEVMRALDAAPALHPDLVAELQDRGLLDEEGTASGDEAVPASSIDTQPAEIPLSEAESESEAEAGTRACAECEGINDADAKFCKHCGKELMA